MITYQNQYDLYTITFVIIQTSTKKGFCEDSDYMQNLKH